MKARKKALPKDGKRSPQKDDSSMAEDMAGAVEAITTEAGEIGKIRNILFGNQMADYDKRFKQLEERIANQVAALGDKTDKRLKEIEALIRKQDETLTGRLDSEHSERNQGAEALSNELTETKAELATAIDALAAQQARELEAIHNQLTSTSNELSDEIHIQQVEASKNLDHAIQALDDEKLARKAMSQMLLEMAGRLTDPSG